jgi:hypothetical protein
MVKQLEFRGKIVAPRFNENCRSLVKFNCKSSTDGRFQELNFFCTPENARTRYRIPPVGTPDREEEDDPNAPEYFFLGTYLHIPDILERWDPKTGNTYELKGNFSGIVITEKKEINNKSQLIIQSPMVYGKDCGELFAFKETEVTPGEGADPNQTDSNVDSMIFEFNNHFFIPFTLGNGQFAYYVIEGKRVVDNWINFIRQHDYNVGISVRGPIKYENILGVTFTKSVFLVEKDAKTEPGKVLPAKYYDPMTEECHVVGPTKIPCPNN